ncbi:hypothetical protein CXF68_16690 [Tenacibaculum sp. Bg11-29]|uniref:hypothetical protein n=1 Tax=Tenacibaculum sp. Bg11-29 TaxID=2058306 RepID=UPI000C321826|nr:hypothetical protein [Tenacibaculum sp. Bg11-29]PKH52228.1 hypothetical protein CXF68_16690 [Tenacibaculum sp. Bg11-29]
MVKQLITDFFNEIEKKEIKKNKNSKASFWHLEFQENLNINYGDENHIGIRKATRLYEKYIEEKEKSVKDPNKFQRNYMSKYLGHEDYDDYIKKTTDISLETEKNPVFENAKTTIDRVTPIKWYKKDVNKLVVIASTVFMLVLSIYTYQNNYSIKGNCIIWKTDHFEKSSCLAKKAINNGKYAINIETFKRITVTDSTIFFKKNIPLVWYGKNIKGEGEYFTDRGVHPETLKRLNPITRPILNREKLLNE